MVSFSNDAGSNRVWLSIEELLIVPESHRRHPQIHQVKATDSRKTQKYNYLCWEVTHPPTPIV
jgi:hypothetical protein